MSKLSEEEKRARKNACSKAYRIAHLEERRAYDKAYAEKNKERKKACRAARKEKQKVVWEAYYAANKEKIKARRKGKRKAQAVKYNLKSKYGLTVEDYRRMFEAQGGRCKLCGKESRKRMLDVDHNHETGKVRELLCHRCNVGLGHFDDDPNLLLMAAVYLEENR